ncbi:hypothetical protein PYW07_002065 [Mythimna separata]|uniref:Lysozyme n=1 Tax=Mythimna separata TaxID=271217 RepID=A0AAD7YMN3_MYTSE|nr:hypothetical protein PYW07_002065 [Mythimna separata]
MQKITILFIALATICLCEGKHFTRCELVTELRKQRFPEYQLRHWVCLIEHESGRDTKMVNSYSDGTLDCGLFQINGRDGYLHGRTKPGKDCNVTCPQLLSDDITIASNCAKRIYESRQFRFWNGWKKHCRGKGLPDIRQC